MRYNLLVAVFSFLIVLNFQLKAQNVGINSSGAIPDASAMLDVSATNMGLLIPRVALSQTGLATPITAPSTSLLVYNTASVNDVTPGYYYWDGGQWVRFFTGSQSDDWTLLGNAGTNPSTNFIGTTDALDFVIRTNNTEKLRVESGGDVGIGVSDPIYKLDVRSQLGIALSGSSPDNFIKLDASGASSMAFIGFNTLGKLQFKAQSSSTYSASGFGSSATIMTIDGTTNHVGIGETSPTQKLAIVENTPFTLGGSDTGVDNIYLENHSMGAGDGNYGGSISFSGPYNGGGGAPRRHAAIVGVQVTSETDYVGLAFFTHNSTTSTGNMQESMRLTHNGNLGIGTTAPTAQLHTTGSVRFQGAGTPAAGRVLTSDANGNATWQAPGAAGADYDWEINGNDIFTGHGGSYPSGGYLGIGTATPAKLVHIIGDNSTPEDLVIEDNGGTYSYLHMCIRNKTGSGTMSYSFSQQAGNMHFAGLDFDPGTEQLILRNNYHSSNGFGNGVITFNTRNAGGSGERMRVDNDGNLGVAVTGVRSKVHVWGGLSLGANASTGINTTYGQQNAIQINSDTYFGGVHDEHSGYLIYSIMPGGWTDAELHFCTSNNWGVYTTGTPALRVTQTTTYANGTALTSDKRLKKDVQENPYGIETIMQLKALKYKKLIVDSFANGEMVFNKSIQIDEVGFFAQDVYNIIPEVVLKPKDETKETWAIDYSKIVPILTQAIQDQQEIIDNMKEEHQQKIEELEKQNREILKRLEEIEKNN
jgi:hypothetical protein